MNKKLKISEYCVISTDDKGEKTLVSKAKEALVTMQKNKVDVTILLHGTSKEDAEQFLKDEGVPYKDLVPWSESSLEKSDVVIMPSDNVALHRDNWEWTIDTVVDKLYRDSEQPPRNDQQKMNEKWSEYKRWADEANKARNKKVVG